MRYTHNFELGDLVMPTRNYKRRGLEKGQLYEVVGKDNDQLTLKAGDGQYLQVDTGFNKAVYQHQHIEIAEGDRLRWTKNDRQLGRRNGQEFVVKAVAGYNAQIEYLDSGQTEFIDLQQAQHLDYAIVSTTYSSQGKTADHVLMAADQTIGQESFYVAVSRARYSLKLYTEDKDSLLALAQSSRAKENALVLLRQKELEKQNQSRPEKEKVTSVAIVTEQPTSKQQRSYLGAEEQFYTESSPLHLSSPSAPLPISSPPSLCPSDPPPCYSPTVRTQPQKLAEISIADSQQEDTQSTIKQTIDALSDQELLYLEQAVQEYFDQPVAQVPEPIDRQAIEAEISQIEPQLDSLWSLHATQKEIITAMERLPFHKLSNKYNSTLEQQLQTLGIIKELFTYKQQLQSLIQEYETQIENHFLWEQHQETIEMKIIVEVLNSPPLQERLNNVKDELWQKEQQKQEELIVKYQSSNKQSRGMRR